MIPTVTRPGIEVWRFLRTGDRRRAIGLLAFPFSAPELVYQCWVIAMRRSFARDGDERRALAFVSDFLGSEAAPPSASTTKVLVGLAMYGAGGTRRDVSRGARNQILPMLFDLVRGQALSDDQLAELVRAAEKRLQRLRRKTARVPRNGSTEATWGRGPRSVIGQTLKAQATYDRETLEALPVEPSDEAVNTVVESALLAVLHERFAGCCCPELVMSFSQRVAKTGRDPRLDDSMVAAIVQSFIDRRQDTLVDMPLELTFGAKVLAFVQAIEDLALYEREVDQILLAAERGAEEAGVQLRRIGDIKW